MLHTVCLSADAIRAMCRWDPQSLLARPATAGLAAATLTSGAIPPGVRHPVQRAVRNERQWNALVGGACTMSGLAVIAWLMASHPRHSAAPALAAAPEVTLDASASGVGPAGQEKPLHSIAGSVERPAASAPAAWNRARNDLSLRGPDQTVTTYRAPASAQSANVRLAPTEAAAKGATTYPASRGVDAIVGTSAKSTAPPASTHRMREARTGNLTKHERKALASTAPRRTSNTIADLSDAAPRSSGHASAKTYSVAPLAVEHRTRHAPSVAGEYSPVAPSARLDSEYESVTISASTHVRNIAPAASRQDHVNSDNNDWMNHMSQRRVTEIPESFSK